WQKCLKERQLQSKHGKEKMEGGSKVYRQGYEVEMEELPCAIASLVKLYKGTRLIECETKESQTIQHADSKKPKSCLPLYNDFFPKLVQIETHLEDFSLYEKHNNQLIASDFFRQMLSDSSLSK
ncbi:4997_t:CDS:2, partial [Racocetra fulgida]